MMPALALRFRNHLSLIVATGLLMLLLAPDACSASQTYTLYYIDTTHNVSKVVVDSTGHPVGKPKQLTSGGKYNGYSVSPDERYVIGMQLVSGEFGGLWEWDQYIERPGRGVAGRIRNKSITDSYVPYAMWLPKINSVVYVVPQQVNSPDYLLYSLQQRRVLFHEINEFGPVSSDQRYAFVTEDVGCADEGPADLRVLDLTTGKFVSVRKVQFEEPMKWLGQTHQFAFIGSDHRVWAGEVTGTGSGLRVSQWSVTRYGGCSGLRYTPGKGIYFQQKAGDGTIAAYYTADLRELHKTARLSEESWQESDKQHQAEQRLIDRILQSAKPGHTAHASREYAYLTADHQLLVANFALDGVKWPEIRVLTRDGKSVTIASGKAARWKDTSEGE